MFSNDLFSVFDNQEKKHKISSENDENIEKIKRQKLEVIEINDHSEEGAERTMGETKKEEKEFPSALIDPETGLQQEQHKISVTHSITHQVSLPDGYNYVPLSEHQFLDPPNRTYPFVLDTFQKQAVACIERNESVLVSAHTSAGKTVVAEYAIATALKNKQRVIYTSPIKALSNQKYRELLQAFGDVGLQTGDVTINPSACCLVMTTEILRSMMYRGSEHMREVAWVVFDEVHYMRDKERGVVWEETIILLPHKVRYVFLSATIPNALEFADWICFLHNQPCHIVYTDYRPVPLQNYIFPMGGDGIHLVVDENSQFKEKNFLKAISTLDPNKKDSKSSKASSKNNALKAQSDLYKIVRMIWQRNYQPVIVFSFSKRECESNAMQISKLDFSNEDEKDLIKNIFKNAIASLNEEDMKLPQISTILPLLERGIGIHHSGLLPILKEVIEILFQEGLIKVLFATETFSIGLNMPAKTVVFTDITKFDGVDTRMLSSGEYIQMSGRAGRRGLDDRGIVIMMLGNGIEPDKVKTILQGKADALLSAFHQKYSMILNLLRVEGIEPEYMLQKSFFQFQNTRTVPKLELELQQLETIYSEISIENESLVKEYFELEKILKVYESDYRKVVFHPTFLIPFVQPGRLVRVVKDDSDVTSDYGWCVVVNFVKKAKPSYNKDSSEDQEDCKYVITVLANCEHGAQSKCDTGIFPKPSDKNQRGEFVCIPVELTDLFEISTLRLFLPKDLTKSDARKQTFNALQEVFKRFENKIPRLDPIADMGIKDEEFLKLIKKIETLEVKKSESSFVPTELQYKQFCEKQSINDRMKSLKKKIKKMVSVIQLDELKARMRVLRRLGFVNSDDVIELKGRVACEITAGDELVLTELLFNGGFTGLTLEQIVALLSCCVDSQEKSGTTNGAPMKPILMEPFKMLQETVRRVARVSTESKVELNEEAYLNRFGPDLMQVAYDWASGVKFIDICKSTDIFEGSIIRSLRRLEELLRQMVAAAKQIGNDELEKKFEECILKIRRDIVFAASLYL